MSKLFLISVESMPLDDIYRFGKANNCNQRCTTKGTSTMTEGFGRDYLQKCFLKSKYKSGQFCNWSIISSPS